MSSWDTYFMNMCEVVASRSRCLSRKIGAVLVRENSIISTGYNGPPRGIPHCGIERMRSDEALNIALVIERGVADIDHKLCPRKQLGFPSGEGMQWCPAQHAEENAVTNAARNGVSTLGCTCYLNTLIPCSKCFGTLINAGIIEIVSLEIRPYDKQTQFLIDNSKIEIRKPK